MSTDMETLVRAIRRGEVDAARRLVRTLGDPTPNRAARVALEDLDGSVAAPWIGALLVQAKQWADAADCYEAWVVDADAPAAWHLAQLCKACQRLGDVDRTYRAAARFHPWDLDYESRAQAARSLARVRRRGAPADFPPLEVALLGSFNTASIEPVLHVAVAGLGFELKLHTCEMDGMRLEIANPSSPLYAHDPRAVILATTWRDLTDDPAPDQTASWAGLWDVLLERTRAQIIQHTFDRPPSSPLGHLDVRTTTSARHLAAAVNQAMLAEAPSRVSFARLDDVVHKVGQHTAFDPRQWHWAKEAVARPAVPLLVEEYAAILRGLTGRSRKVLVLDLDNTTWGGIVGEDGVEGLKVGPPSPVGEAHQALQRYAAALKKRGVLLAVCSKNNDADARAPFEQLDDMVLGLDDFVAFEATWHPKPERVQAMAQQLNLGLDSFVFIDDNPAERARMRRQCPTVLTLPVGDDISTYTEVLDRARAFDVLAVSSEDAKRSEQYRAERHRAKFKAEASSPEAYYRSLEMVATVSPFRGPDHTRIVQLAGRSNQFNLTTWRLTQGDVERLQASPDHMTATIRLKDRYGDYGLVLILVAEQQADALAVVQWCMSCRVIGRTVEDLVLAQLDAEARRRGCKRLVGIYKPTKKNGLVRDLYPRLGFTPCNADSGEQTYERAIGTHEPIDNPYIRVHRPASNPGE